MLLAARAIGSSHTGLCNFVIYIYVHGLGFGDPHWDSDSELGAAIPIALS